MAIVVVGGGGRGAGKTNVMVMLIAAMPERRWTAIKISPEPAETAAACEITVEHVAAENGKDTQRYLATGANRALLVRGSLASAMPQIQDEITAAENVIIESNAILAFLRPDIYVSVVGGSSKTSAQRFLDRADLLVSAGHPVSPDQVPSGVRHVVETELAAFVSSRINALDR